MASESNMTSHRKPLTDFRRATPKDIGWDKTIFLVCDENSRNVILHEMKIKKLNLSEVPPKVGHNAFQHDTERDNENAEMMRRLKKLAGHYLVMT